LHQTAEVIAKVGTPIGVTMLCEGNMARLPEQGRCSSILGGMQMTDRWLVGLDQALRTVAGAVHAARPNPAHAVPAQAAADGNPAPAEGPVPLTAEEKLHAGALMRVNHVGEVCAQALYQAQALTARTEDLRQQMQQAAREETDHLAWTAERLQELGARPSLLNPLWYAGAFGIGVLAGRLGDRASLAFVVETERQVEAHLASHLDQLPPGDTRSRAIVAVMKEDERRHADEAQAAGALDMPAPLRWAMRAAARVMTSTAYRV
jgi:ubiquinone biosynthesis monooxygenase Coq7